MASAAAVLTITYLRLNGYQVTIRGLMRQIGFVLKYLNVVILRCDFVSILKLFGERLLVLSGEMCMP